jgi:class 3 adenylate cyclase/tetratricopeptide (TPR) repeat protein
VALHTKALRVMADPADDARLAYHAEAAGDVEAVLRHAPQAARRASLLGAHRESAAQYARALRFAERLAPAERAELLERRSYECMLTDQVDDAIGMLRTAIELRHGLGDPVAEGQALNELSEVLWCPGQVAEAREAALQAVALLERVPPSRELAIAYGRLASLCMDAEDLEETVSWGARSLELAQRFDDSELIVHALSSVGTARFLHGQSEGRAQLERSLALAQEAGLEADVGRTMIHFAWVAQRRRDYPLAAETLEPALKYVSDRGLELWRSYLLADQAQMQLDLGRWRDAAETAMLVLSEPRRSRVPQIVALTVIGRVRARRGEPEVWPLLNEARSLAARGEELQATAPVAGACAEAFWLEGDRAGVERVTDAPLALARHRRSRWVTSELVSWRRRAGIIDQLSTDEATGPYALELAGEWSTAAAKWRELGCPYEAELALAETDDENLVRQALQQLQALGARPAAALVARRLRQRGARRVPRGPRRQTQANPVGLTARELEILPLLAQGLRNVQIAQRLVVSQNTVDHHVSAILRKLGVKTRGEAAVEAIRLGLKSADTSTALSSRAKKRDFPSPQRVRRAFVFTDIVDSTPLVSVLGDDAWMSLLQWHDRTLRELFDSHLGHEISHTGDGFFVAFEDANAAVSCAVKIQQKLERHRRENGFAPQVRIGIHLDVANYLDGDYHGHGVHLAARICAQAQGGEVLISRETLKAVRPAVRVGEAKTVQLKGVSHTVDLVPVILV